jgi:hypothetical protein
MPASGRTGIRATSWRPIRRIDAACPGSRQLAHDVARILVRTQALERRVAHAAVVGPLGKRDLGDQLRLDPVPVRTGPRARRLGLERRTCAHDRREQLAQLAQQRLRVAGADLAAVDELACVVVADEQGADVGARALGIRVAADHHLLTQDALGLLPHHAAAGRVRLVAALRHDALETTLARECEEGGAVADDVIAVADRRAGDELCEPRLAILERQRAQILVVEREQVECEVHEVRAGIRERLLQRLEARAAVGHHDADFAVDRGALHRQRGELRDDRRKLLAPVLEPARQQACASAHNFREHAVAVEFLLV